MRKMNLKIIRAKRAGKPLNPHDRIVIDPKIAVGKPVIKGTRLTVDFILKLFGQGMTQNEILKEFPQLEKDDLLAVLTNE